MNLVKRSVKTKTYKKAIKSDIRQMDLMALPGVLAVLIFCYIPMFGVILAFKQYNPNVGILASKWVGFDNFKFFFASSDFTMLMRNTLAYSLWFLVVDNFFAILFAILCYNIRSKEVKE